MLKKNKKRKRYKKNYRILIFFLIIISFISFTYFLNPKRQELGLEKYIRDISVNIYKSVTQPKVIKYDINIDDSINKNLENEIDSLTKVLELTHDLGRFTYINATILSRNVSYWLDEVIIDKGSSDGINKDNAVITPNGLIGKIKNTTKHTSTIKLLTSSTYKVSVKVDNAYGILSKYDSKKKIFIVDNIDINETITKGDMVETSGLGGVFPSGIYIGKVISVKKVDYGTSKELEVKPKQDFNDIKYVTILEKEND